MATKAGMVIGPKSKRGLYKVSVGDVTVYASKPTAKELDTNLTKSRDAVRGLGATLAKPGVRIPAKKDVPLYWADDQQPNVIIRQLNGRIERGRFNGKIFKVAG